MEDKFKSYCRKCSQHTDAEKNAEILAKHSSYFESDDGYVDATTYYYVIRCEGCEQISFLEEFYFSEDEPPDRPRITYWPPKELRRRPSWLNDIWEPRSVRLLFDELYKALDQDARVLAGIAVRTIFDGIAAHLNIDETKPFADKLKDLVANGDISKRERDSLEVLVDAGNAAAHRGWRPNANELNQLVDILEHFAKRVLFIDNNAKVLKPKIPPKTKHTKSKTRKTI